VGGDPFLVDLARGDRDLSVVVLREDVFGAPHVAGRVEFLQDTVGVERAAEAWDWGCFAGTAVAFLRSKVAVIDAAKVVSGGRRA
jgi:hypothetical protein